MATKAKLLVVDNDASFRETLVRFFNRRGYAAKACSDAAQALAALNSERWEAVLTDLQMPGADGLELLGQVKEWHPGVPVILMTGHGTVETAVRALKAGAADFIAKPFEIEDLIRTVGRALEQSRAHRQVQRLRDNLREMSPEADLVGRSAAMKLVREQVETVARTQAAVLITGERGTGKEVVARAIHAGSGRAEMPMAVIRCGAMNGEILQEELFGFERIGGSGVERRKGKFEYADGGSVFLDEVSEIPAKTQTDLLEVIETGRVVRVGGSIPVRVDLRWIAATNRELGDLVARSRFRSDLYYQLNVFSVVLPPLRERREDIPLFVDHFLQKHAKAMNRTAPPVSRRAMDLLLTYRWPGNVRELENAVERALLIARDEEIRPSHFPFQLEIHDGESEKSLREVERRHIQAVVERCGWNLAKTARVLGIDRTTLYNKLHKYGLR